MKIVYEPGEIERLESRHSECVKEDFGTIFQGTDPDKLYGITFKVTNPALASYILGSLLNNRLDDFEMGIDVQSINYNIANIDSSDLSEKLHKMIDEIV